MQSQLNEVLEREIEKQKRSKFYRLRKKDSHGNRTTRRYHVPVLPSYRELNEFHKPIQVKLPKCAKFLRMDYLRQTSAAPEGIALWFAAPKEETDDVRTFMLSRNDEAVEPPELHNLTWLDSQSHPDGSTMFHAFEVERTPT